jgi:flagellin-like protein
MKIHHRTLQNNNAISEIVGSVILLLIAVLSFSAIYLYVFPLPSYVAESNVDIQGSVSGEFPELVHVGGETLQEYQIFVDGSLYKDQESPEGTRYDWKMGDRKPLNIYGKKTVAVIVVSKLEDGGTDRKSVV